jgi:hypothetical protein
VNRRPATDDSPGYFQILQEFNASYPRYTNVHCWWCCHQFDNHPIGIPIKYDKPNDIFKVLGCFCSFECAYAYSRKEQRKIYLSDFRILYQKVTGEDGQHIMNIRPAPERYVLKMFGGQLTIEEFRSSFRDGTKFEIMYSPMVPYGIFCDEAKLKSRGWIKDGVRKPLVIRKATKKQESSTSDVITVPKTTINPLSIFPQLSKVSNASSASNNSSALTSLTSSNTSTILNDSVVSTFSQINNSNATRKNNIDFIDSQSTTKRTTVTQLISFS